MSPRTRCGLRGSALLGLALLASCLNVAGDPDPLRSFRPALSEEPPPPAVAVGRLDLRQVRGAAHLKDRMAYRASDVEFDFHQAARWAELPEDVVQRALSRSLFESGAFVRCSRAATPVLQVELRAFETDRATAEVVVGLGATLTKAEGWCFEREYRARRPLRGDGPEAMARAIGPCLESCVEQLAAELRERAAGEGAGAP